MGLHQSTNSVRTIDSGILEEHIRKMDALNANVSALLKENKFLRRRIDDLTEYSSILEDELSKGKVKSAEKDEDFEKYIQLNRKLESENERLTRQNNKLLLELFSPNDPRSTFARLGTLGQANDLKNPFTRLGTLQQASEKNQREEIYNEKTKATISPLLRLHSQLDNLKFEVDSTKSNLLNEIDGHKSNANDYELNKLVQEHESYNQKLIEQGVFVGDKSLQQMEQTYRYLCLKNNERKIEVMKEICKIESALIAFYEQLNSNTGQIIDSIGPILNEHENTFSTELKGVSFVNDDRNEKMIYDDLVSKLSIELAYFRKLLPSGSNDAVESKSDASNVNRNFPDTSDDKSAFKGWSFDVFD